ncbi:hypothetical protein [Paenirhodobacter sp. CAU 1674]|uniref:hypothetical protein n=1 Tax=Paenirhodobacter sp. CAU 1674 TaxID=3032596 RepID=UPI0023D9AA75|nr:hypothetical protein [Paenirhodobacter sp. CAU 1674]MDF2142929.1 hypothetical protein [Paenirhodobacter sp. CAU 1674]
MNVRVFFAACAVCVVGAAPVVAQSLTPDEIRAKVEEKTNVTNGYQVLLNDPDPARSMAAMEVMLESGDAKLQRMALEFGLYSPNPQVRYTALKAYFDGEPVLSIGIDGGKIKNQDQFGDLIREIGGTINGQGDGFSTMKVGEIDAAQSCYLWPNSSSCFIRLSETGVAISLWREWAPLQLDDQGNLVGTLDITGPAPITIPVSY